MKKGCIDIDKAFLESNDKKGINDNNKISKETDISQINQKKKYFNIVKQNKNKNIQFNQYFINNQIHNNSNNIFPNSFVNFGNNSIFRQNNNNSFPLYIDNNFYNFHKEKKKKNQIILIINNYINIENPLPKKEEETKDDKKIQLSKELKTKNLDSPSTSTINSSKIQSIQKKNDSSTIKFVVAKDILNVNNEIKMKILNKKRGRKSNKKGKREHSAFDQDNIIRKIQVHFITFIIDFTNDVIQNILIDNKDLFFKSINYEFKKTVNHSYLEKLNFLTIGDILKLKISPKIKKYNENINEIIYNKLCNMNSFFKKFFETSYLDMFNQYYYQKEREVDVNGFKVKLSSKSKLFPDLLAKNKESSVKIKEIAEQYFVNKRKNDSQIFCIKKI